MFCTPGGRSPSVCMPVDTKLNMCTPHVKHVAKSSRLTLTALFQPWWQAKAEIAILNAQSCHNSIEAIPLTCAQAVTCTAILSAPLMLTSYC